MAKRLILITILAMMGLLLMGSSPPEPGDGCRTNETLPDGTGVCEFGADPETGDDVLLQENFGTCTLTANRPNGRHGRIIGSGSLYCSGDVERMRLQVHLQRKVLPFIWLAIGTVDTGWVYDVNYLGRTLNEACVTGTHQYRTMAVGFVRGPGQLDYGSGVTISSSIQYTC